MSAVRTDTQRLETHLRAALGVDSPKPRTRPRKPAAEDGATLRLLGSSAPAPAPSVTLLTSREAAALAGCSLPVLLHHHRLGRINPVAGGGKGAALLFSRADIEQWAAQRAAGGWPCPTPGCDRLTTSADVVCPTCRAGNGVDARARALADRASEYGDVMPLAEAAVRVGLSQETIRTAMQAGEIVPAVQSGPGGATLLRTSDVDAWAAARLARKAEARARSEARDREAKKAYTARKRAERDAARAAAAAANPDGPDLVSISSAAAKAGLSRCTLTRAIEDGEVPIVGEGKMGAHLVSLTAVRAWAAQRAEAIAERGHYWRETYLCIDGCGAQVRYPSGRCEECRRRVRAERMVERRAREREAYLQRHGEQPRRGPKPGTPRSAAAPKPKAVVPAIVAPNVSPRPVRVEPAPPPAQTIARDAAIEEGMAAWSAGRFSAQIAGTGCTIPDPRGFWLVSGPEGFRPERVGATLAAGERAIEQHWRDGFGGWQSRTIETKGKP